jgi:hypothetical protein
MFNFYSHFYYYYYYYYTEQKEANEGEVVVSPFVYQYVERFVDVSITPGKFYKLTSMKGELLGRKTEMRSKKLWDQLNQFDEDQLRKVFSFMVQEVPKPVILSINSGQSEWMADVRVCVTMFIKLKGVKPVEVERVHYAVSFEAFFFKKLLLAFLFSFVNFFV